MNSWGFENEWDGTLEGLFDHCPFGGRGSYQSGQSICEWNCAVRESCKSVKEKLKKEKTTFTEIELKCRICNYIPNLADGIINLHDGTWTCPRCQSANYEED